MKVSITFIEQGAPVDEYGRALYAVARSVIRALLDALSSEDLADLNTPLEEVRMRQLAKVARLELDKGMKGDGFEWAVHEAILGPLSVIDHLEADIDAKLKSAQALRQSILRHAFTGKLVPQDPNDEPASELLKRIAAEREARVREAASVKSRPRSTRKTGRKRP